MDIEINAQGREVKIVGIECDVADDCVSVALSLWLATDTQGKHSNPIGGTGFQVIEKAEVDSHSADLESGERPIIK